MGLIPEERMEPVMKEVTVVLHRRALRLEWFTAIWNVIEAGVAIGAGVLSGSLALIAFGFDSLIEVLSAAAVLWRLISAGPEASQEENQAAEKRALTLVGITFFLLAAYVVIEAVSSILAGDEPGLTVIGLVLAAISLIVMPILAYSKQVTAAEMGSRALRADAIETWVCAFLSAALLLGLGLHRFLGWWWADSAAALAMTPFIVWQGWEAFEEGRGSGEQED